jgi:hypothetical protein
MSPEPTEVDDEFEQLEADPYGVVDGVATRWVTKDGRNLLIAEMGDQHLQNALRMLERQLADMREGDLLPDMMGGLFTEIARRAAGSRVAVARRVADHERVCAPILKGLRAELQRRGLPELVP